jgi:hypothetical protein
MRNFTFPFLIPVIVQGALTKWNKLIGGIAGLGVTTALLFWGVHGYADGGEILLLFIPIPKAVFIGLIALWYAADVGTVLVGIEERRMAVAHGSALSQALGEQKPPKELFEQALAMTQEKLEKREEHARGDEKGVAEAFRRIRAGEDYADVLAALRQQEEGKETDLEAAAVKYRKAVDETAKTRYRILRQAEQHGVAIAKDDVPGRFQPGCILGEKVAGAVSGSLVVTCSGQLIRDTDELRSALESAGEQKKVPLGILAREFNPFTGTTWKAVKKSVKPEAVANCVQTNSARAEDTAARAFQQQMLDGHRRVTWMSILLCWTVMMPMLASPVCLVLKHLLRNSGPPLPAETQKKLRKGFIANAILAGLSWGLLLALIVAGAVGAL